MSTTEKFAVLYMKGGAYKVIERRVDQFKDEFYVVVAEAADSFEARKIVAALNAEASR